MRFEFGALALAVGGARGAGPSLRFAPTQTHGPVGMPNVAEAPTLNLENRYANRHEPYPVPGHGLVGGGGGGGGAATTFMGGCDQYTRQACAGLEYCFDNSWPKYTSVADDDVRRAILRAIPRTFPTSPHPRRTMSTTARSARPRTRATPRRSTPSLRIARTATPTARALRASRSTSSPTTTTPRRSRASSTGTRRATSSARSAAARSASRSTGCPA